MRISIALATFNGSKYLPAQLKSYLDQTRLPDELIVSDDGSTDDTRMILMEFAETAPFEVRLYVNNENRGYANNFNHAILHSTGELVFLSDQDDVWFPQKLEYIEKLAKENPSCLLFMNDAALTDENLNNVGLTKLSQIRSLGLQDRYFVMGCCCAVKRELLDLCMPIPNGIKAHDDWIVNFADELSVKVVSERVLQYYRRHGTNQSQFIANRTTKVTKWDRYRGLVHRILSPVNNDLAQLGIMQQTLILSGILRAQDRADQKFLQQLKAIETKQRSVVMMMRTRMDIRRKNMPVRLIASLGYWLRGGYRCASGFKSLVRDLRG